MTMHYRRRVGSARPSHLMFTAGVGSLVDLPNFSVLIRGLDDWNFSTVTGNENWETITEPRLLAAVGSAVGPSVTELKPAPWLPGLDNDPTGPASRVGVPTTPFPTWLRCTACNELAPIDAQVFKFENDKPRRPHDARFFHDNCTRKKSGRRPLAVAARFVMCCTAGHLDDFPYREFVHRGEPCPSATHPRMQMDDRGGNLGANVQIRCVSCGQSRHMRDAMGQRGEENLPSCRARHPHRMSSRGIVTAAEVGTLTRGQVLDFAEANDDEQADALLLPDTALHTVAWLDELEQRVCKPVLTANQVSAWEGLRLAGCQQTHRGLGALFHSAPQARSWSGKGE